MYLKIYIKTFVAFIAFYSVFAMSGYPTYTTLLSDSNDPITGMYYLYGTKTSTIYPCTWTCFDMEPYVDVESVASVVNIRRMEENPDTLLFFGLPGADEGKRGLYFGMSRSYYDNLFPIQMYREDVRYRITGQLTGNLFEINLMGAGPSYEASGILDNGVIELNGRYHYRERTFEFDLRGEKIEL